MVAETAEKHLLWLGR